MAVNFQRLDAARQALTRAAADRAAARRRLDAEIAVLVEAGVMQKEIAERLEVSEGAVRKALKRAREEWS